jgi:serine/threonine protein kinase
MGPAAEKRKASGCLTPVVKGDRKKQNHKQNHKQNPGGDEEKSDEEKSDDEVRESSIVGCSLVLLGSGKVEIYGGYGGEFLGSFNMRDMIAEGKYGMLYRLNKGPGFEGWPDVVLKVSKEKVVGRLEREAKANIAAGMQACYLRLDRQVVEQQDEAIRMQYMTLTQAPEMMIMPDYGPDLFSCIEAAEDDNLFSALELLQYARAVVSAVVTNLSAGRLHRDINPENICINTETFKATLVDLDSTVKMINNLDFMFDCNFVGTGSFHHPMLLESLDRVCGRSKGGSESHDFLYSTVTDCYSLAETLMMLFTGYKPGSLSNVLTNKSQVRLGYSYVVSEKDREMLNTDGIIGDVLGLLLGTPSSLRPQGGGVDPKAALDLLNSKIAELSLVSSVSQATVDVGSGERSMAFFKPESMVPVPGALTAEKQ